MQISLQMNGREIKFSEHDLFAKMKRFEELDKMYPDIQSDVSSVCKVTSKPTDGHLFMITPTAIDKEMFKEKRNDFMQEWTRQAIINALNEMKLYPEKYGKPFATYMPTKSWRHKTVAEIKALAKTNGDHMADWVEQSLEWAQRLTNGEPWEAICNNPDTSNWYRLIIWKNGNTQIVGGSHLCKDILPACTVFGNNSEDSDELHFTVPLIVIYV